MSKTKYGTWAYWRDEWVKPFIIAIILALLIRAFIVQPFKIPSSSMEPTLKPGDRIFVNKFIYGAKIPFTGFILPKVRSPEFGDIIVFLSPWESKKFLVKRFIAAGPHTVEISHGHLVIDGKEVEFEDLDVEYVNGGEYGKAGSPVKIPEGYFYALGDNSKNSVDSRFRGFIPEENLIGKAFIIHWPVRRMRVIK